MSAPRRRNRPLTLVSETRGFRLTVTAGRGETYGLILEETYGGADTGLAAQVVSVNAAQTARVLDAVLAAVRGSGHQPSVMAFSRTRPIALTEPDGVRLALVLVASAPIAKDARVRALTAGISAMSPEETYYWYSKCVGVDAKRARRALRILLAED